LSIKINLLDKEDFPDSFLKYKIHDGRVTFTVPNEFELDLSIADEDRSSQFFFVDLRFLFSPSSPIPEGRLRDSIEWKANEILRTGGLPGCFNFLHNMVLTTKVEHFGNLASVMARGPWTEALRVDLHHRTLVVQYWTGRPAPKSWLEIGIKSGHRKDPTRSTSAPGISFVDIRWLREKQEAENTKIKFDIENINFESTLRSVTALHISHILRSMYDKLMEGGMYHEGKMGIRLTISCREPLDCELALQLTKTKFLKVIIEPVSGRVILQPPSPLHNRFEHQLNASRDLVKDGGLLLGQLRCFAVKEEVEYRARTIGWDVLQNVRLPDADKKRFLPKDAVTFSLLRQPTWRQGWHLLSTHGLSSDLWWTVQMKSRVAPAGSVAMAQAASGFGLQSAETIDTKYIDPPSAKLSFDYFKNLSFIASGIICLHANTLGLVKHKVTHEPMVSPTSSDLPYLLVKFDTRKLPSLLPKVKVPSGPWCVEAIRFSYQGLNPLTKSAKLLAQGHLTRPFEFDTLVKLNSNSETLVSYNPKNRAFAFHFNEAPGIPVALGLLDRLRRFERLLRTLTVFARFKLAPDHITLDKAVFSYATDLRACIDFDYEERDIPLKSTNKLPPASTQPPKTRRKPIIKIQFSGGNPHLRIQRHLISILNEGGGLEEVAFLLKATLPAIQGLDEVQLSHHRDQIGPPSPQPSPLKAIPEPIVLYRSADWYALNYSLPPTIIGPPLESSQTAQSGSQPQSLCNFDLRLKSRRDGIQWELTSSNNRREVELLETTGLAAKLREEIFTAHGPGWRGMEKGVVCDKEDIGTGTEAGLSDSGVGLGDEKGVRDLLKTVDRVVREVVAGMEPAAQENGGQEGRNGDESGAGTDNQGGKNDDVIMID
jgi:mediator of RNA polymerase II transcription subunit 14